MSRWSSYWPPFFWGAATSSHQIEGAQKNDWTEWEQAGGSRDRSGRAADHWRLWPLDLELARDLHLNSYRFSLEWSRIEPEPGHFDEAVLTQYRAMIQRMRDLQLLPFLTLHHFTLPVWVARQGGFAHPDIGRWFMRYVATVLDHLGDLVDFYVTINEPLVLVIMGYIIGIWPPGSHRFTQALRLIRRLADVHRETYHLIKRVNPSAMVGVAHHVIAFVPLHPRSRLDRATSRILRYAMNDRFIRLVGKDQDFLGINYYTRQYGHWATGLHPIQNQPGHPVSDLGWEIDAAGLEEILHRLRPMNKPIIITENGIATGNETVRTQYLQQHLAAIAHAQEQGADIRGYFHWSLLDNFEWAEGFAPRFGLYAVNYDTMQRTLRSTGEHYRCLIDANYGRRSIIVPRV